MKTNGRFVILLTFTTLLLSGCGLSSFLQNAEVNQQLASIDNLSTMSGKIENPFPGNDPIILLVIKMDQQGTNGDAIVNKRIIYRDGNFRLLHPPGNYFIIAFQDSNEDGEFQQTEHVGWHGEVEPIALGIDSHLSDLRVVMRSHEQARQLLPQLYRPNVKAPPVSIPKFAFGEITTLNDPRFSDKNGKLGMWQPKLFLDQVESGFYFLEPYQADKVPVLFVHGVGGNPAQWRNMINGLDRQRFQPWLFYYPSGLRLPLLGKSLSEYLILLQQQYGFKHLAIVAHSMGGLVSRSAINHLSQQQQDDFLQTFVTLSTPWMGHDMAQKGVEYSPLIIPCWYDMAPGSPFLQQLFTTPLSDNLPHCLLFSYHGENSMFATENSDGVIALKSQLRSEAQTAATTIRGFNLNHTEILHDPAVVTTLQQHLNPLLNNTQRKKTNQLNSIN